MKVKKIDDQEVGPWAVVDDDGKLLAWGFATHREAWRWIDKANNEPTGRKEAAHDWSANQFLKS